MAPLDSPKVGVYLSPGDIIIQDDILYVNFKCDFYYNYDEIKPNINYGYTSFDYTVPCPGDDGAMHGRVKSIYDYFFTKIKSKYYLKIIETTKDGISAIKLEKKNI